MQQIRFGMILLAIVILQGCATNYVPVASNTHTDVQTPEPINYIDIDYITYDGMQCMTMIEYSKLAENMLEVKRFIKQNSIIIRKHNELYKGEAENE